MSLHRVLAAGWVTFLVTGPMVTPAMAAGVSYTAVFGKKSQSVYDTGPAVDLNLTRRLGALPIHVKDSIGSISHPLLGLPLGAEVGARGDFDVGLDYSVKINTGSFDVLYPTKITVGAPADFATLANHDFKISTTLGTPLGLGSGVLGSSVTPLKAILQTYSPDLQADVHLDANVGGFIGASACFVLGCTGPHIDIPDIKKSQQLLGININDNGQIEIGDTVVGKANQTFTTLQGNVTGAVGLPHLDAVATQVGFNTPTSLTTVGQSRLAVVNADISGIIGNAFGVPLSGRIGPLAYDILNASAGLALDIRQTLTATFKTIQTYDFLSPVRQLLPDGSWSNPTFEVKTGVNEDITLRAANTSLAVRPSTSVVVTLSNLTELVVDGDISVQALHANIAGWDLGPLFNPGDVNGGIFSIPLYNNTFDVSLGSMQGTPFNIHQSLSDSITAQSGFLYGIADRGPDAANGQLRDYGLYAKDVACGFRACPTQYLGSAGVGAMDSDGDLAFLQNTDTISAFPVVNPDPVDDRAGMEGGLAAAGYAGPTFLSHTIGEPRPADWPAVPEPDTWFLLIAGLGLTGARLRQIRGRPELRRFG